jgi:hypothetical protein
MQLDVPQSIYGSGEYFINDKMYVWLMNYGLNARYELSYGHDVLGRSTRSSIYKVAGIDKVDATAFGIMFPGCNITLLR